MKPISLSGSCLTHSAVNSLGLRTPVATPLTPNTMARSTAAISSS